MADEREKIQRQIQEKAKASSAFSGQGTLWSEPILVINQRAKLFDIVSEYKVFNERGEQIGTVRQEGGKKWLRLLVSKALLPVHVVLYDMAGQVQLQVDKKFAWFRPKVFLQDVNGTTVGQFTWEKIIGKQRIAFTADGQKLGSLVAENWRAWNFQIEDANGGQLGRISKTWAGFGKELFTNADNYVLELRQPLIGTLGAFVLASAICVDTVLKQNNKK